jgi:hypothetical protein
MSAPFFDDLAPDEQQLIGRWIASDHGRAGDAVERRIFWLVSHRLVAIGSASGGWDWLFRDPRDNRLWELTFPLGTVHGRGPRQLSVIAPELAATKYDLPGP